MASTSMGTCAKCTHWCSGHHMFCEKIRKLVSENVEKDTGKTEEGRGGWEETE